MITKLDGNGNPSTCFLSDKIKDCTDMANVKRKVPNDETKRLQLMSVGLAMPIRHIHVMTSPNKKVLAFDITVLASHYVYIKHPVPAQYN